jgi:SAM-dependent methyltransferase
VYAVDVSQEIVQGLSLPANVEVLLSEGTDIPVPAESIDVAYSNQLMEHLHPDDELDQLRNIFAALRPGGVYVCVTPNRLTGPHDISKYFDDVATGFHLKEYTISEVRRLFFDVGFSGVSVLIGARGRFIRAPAPVAMTAETAIAALPVRARRGLARRVNLNPILGIRIFARR